MELTAAGTARPGRGRPGPGGPGGSPRSAMCPSVQGPHGLPGLAKNSGNTYAPVELKFLDFIYVALSQGFEFEDCVKFALSPPYLSLKPFE